MPVLSRLASEMPPPRCPGCPKGAGADGRNAELLLDDREHVAGGEDQVLLTGVLDLGAPVLAVKHHVADLYVERDAVTVVVDPAGADREDGALLRLLLGSVGNHNAGRRGRLGLACLDHDAVLERLDGDLGSGRHVFLPLLGVSASAYWCASRVATVGRPVVAGTRSIVSLR